MALEYFMGNRAYIALWISANWEVPDHEQKGYEKTLKVVSFLHKYSVILTIATHSIVLIVAQVITCSDCNKQNDRKWAALWNLGCTLVFLTAKSNLLVLHVTEINFVKSAKGRGAILYVELPTFHHCCQVHFWKNAENINVEHQRR